MSDDFYPFVDSGDPAPENTHLTGKGAQNQIKTPGKTDEQQPVSSDNTVVRTARISVYDDMLSTPRVLVVEQNDVRTYLEDVTNTVYRTMKEQGGHLTLMIIRELVENFIHAHFSEPIISILDNGDTIRFSDQGPGIGDKELAFEFGVTSANRDQKRYIRGTGSGLPMIQQYVETAGGAISIEDNLGAGTVITVSVNPQRVAELQQSVSRGAAVRSGQTRNMEAAPACQQPNMPTQAPAQVPGQIPGQIPEQDLAYLQTQMPGNMPGYPPSPAYTQELNQAYQQAQSHPQMPTGQGYPSGYPQIPGYPQGIPQGYQQGYPQGQYMQTQPAYPQQMPAAYPQGYPGQASYPQFGNQFSTIPQQYSQAAGMYPGQAFSTQVPQSASNLYISERGALALRFICANTQGGPTDLTREYGSSNGTWSRELDKLARAGLVHKPGQKYLLTEMGQVWMQEHAQ